MKIIAKMQIIILLLLILLSSGCAIFGGPKPEPLPPKEPSVYIEEGDNYQNEGKYDMALESYANALKINDKDIETRRKLSEIYYKIGNADIALNEFAKIISIDNNNIHAYNYRGFIYSNQNKWDEAINEFESSLKIDPNNIYALGHIGLAYKMAGRIEDARNAFDRAIELDPEMDDPESRKVHNYLGLLYKDTGIYDKAIEEYRKTLKHFPEDVIAQNRIGEIYEEMGKYLEAYIEYKKTLKIDPENANAQNRINALEDAGIYYVEAVEIVKDDIQNLIANAPDVSQYPNAGAIILLDKISYEITDNRQIRYTVHWVVKILNDRGIAQYGELSFPFNSLYQNIGINVAKTYLPDGTIVEAAEDAFHDITLPGLSEYNLYSDIMLKVVNMPALEPGAIIEYKATVEDFEGSDEKPWIWGSMTFQGFDPILDAKCVLRVPKDLNINWKLQNCQIDPIITEDEKNYTYIWPSKNNPPIIIEEAMPVFDDIMPSIYFSSNKSWDEVYKWYNELAKEQEETDRIKLFNIGIDYQEFNNETISQNLKDIFKSNNITLSQDAKMLVVEENVRWLILDGKKVYSIDMLEGALSIYDEVIAQKAIELTIDINTEEEKIKALYEYVASKIRYVAIELGQSAYQPTSPVEVLKYKYGDCKDKVTLLVAMLKHIGVESYQALISPSPGKTTNIAIPSVAQFSHVIAAIPNGDGTYIWLDPTASTCKYGDLPAGDQGRKAFIIGKDFGEFVDTPIYPAEANKVIVRSEISIHDDGSINGWEKTITNGQADMYQKMVYRLTAPDKHKSIIAGMLNPKYPGLQIDKLTLSDLYDLDKPTEILVDFSCPNYTVSFGNMLIFSIPSEDFSVYASLVSGNDVRNHEFHLNYNMIVERELKISIPKGYKLASLPNDIEIKNDIGSFSRKYEAVDDSNVKYSASLEINTRTISVYEYSNLKKLIEEASKEDRAQIVLIKSR